MHFQFEVTQQPAPPQTGDAAEATALLRQMLEVQRQSLELQRAALAVHDAAGRWRTVLSRWQGDFPGLPESCKLALPLLERAYIDLIAEMTDHLRSQGGDAIANEFALAEFLDRYGMRLSQLAQLLSVVGPIAEMAATEK
jgi:hypothetical protein